jgi:membrane protein implicated in regulation of membrane protease activity
MILSSSLIWFLVGVAFLIAELAVPGFILIFFTAGCWIAALATWLLLFVLRKYSLKIFKGKTRDGVDDHYTDSKIGKTAIVTKIITPNMPGEIKVMGSFWRAIAEMEIEEGQSVLIESQESEDGLTLKVKPV